MANNRTLLQLRTSVLSRGQYEGSSDIIPINLGTGLPDPSMLNEFINEAIQETYDILVQKWHDRFTLTGASFSIVSGTDSYALDTIAPAFYKLRKVEVLMSGTGAANDPTNRWKRLFPHDLDAQHLYSQWGFVAKGYRYRIQGQNLVLAPMPAAPDTARVFYIPYATKLVVDTDTFDGVNGYEELVIQLALLRCKAREELPTDDIEREIARLTARVRTADDGRDAAEPFYLNAAGPGSGNDMDDDGGGWYW